MFRDFSPRTKAAEFCPCEGWTKPLPQTSQSNDRQPRKGTQNLRAYWVAKRTKQQEEQNETNKSRTQQNLMESLVKSVVKTTEVFGGTESLRLRAREEIA